MNTGCFFDIKKYAVHDGPNIRTTVFFKGCPLRCFWCHNPEGMSPAIQIVHVASKCIGCMTCVNSCSETALHAEPTGLSRDRSRCISCQTCVRQCPALAQEAVGWEADPSKIIAEIRKDMPFYDTSGGGVTFSGGEPFMQPKVLRELLIECGKLELHRVVDTTGYADPALIASIVENIDLFLYDIKHMDDKKHREHTGVGNELILRNLTMLAGMGSKIRIRLPLIGGINADSENIRRTARFAGQLGNAVQGIDLLPYHSSASAKYAKLGLADTTDKKYVPSETDIQEALNIFENYNLSVQIGG